MLVACSRCYRRNVQQNLPLAANAADNIDILVQWHGAKAADFIIKRPRNQKPLITVGQTQIPAAPVNNFF